MQRSGRKMERRWKREGKQIEGEEGEMGGRWKRDGGTTGDFLKATQPVKDMPGSDPKAS